MAKEDNTFQLFLIGALAGAVAAAFMTPYRGEEVRNELEDQYQYQVSRSGELGESVERLRQKTSEKFLNVIEQLKFRLNSLTKRFNDLTDRSVEVLLEDEIL